MSNTPGTTRPDAGDGPGQVGAIGWAEGRWTHEPVANEVTADGELVVTAAEGSDAWRVTSYGFVHDSEHALVAALPNPSAMEVVFTADFIEQFDQAGLFVVSGAECWVKAGVEFADGHPQVGAVVTNPVSDWSVAPVDEWQGRRVRVRVSRSGDALTLRAGLDGEELRLVRVAPYPESAEAEAGPLVSAPSRAGLTVRFHEWILTTPDASLH